MSETATSAAAVVGRCKWFDEKKGYGFIAVCDGPLATAEVFVHHKNIKPGLSTRKTLRAGEYVSMRLQEPEGDGKPQAVNVTGVLGGPLMCDHSQLKRKIRADKNPVAEISPES
jgi:cold shock CspA family protein